MKTITITKTRKTLIKNFFSNSIFIILIMLIFIGLGVMDIVRKDNLFTSYEGNVTVLDTTIQNDTKKYGFMLDTSDITFTVNIKDEIILGDQIKLDILNYSSNINVVKLDINGINNYNNESSYINNVIGQIIIIFIIVGAALIFIIFRLVKALTTPLEKTYDYIEYMLTSNKVITNSMFDSTFSISRKLRIFSLLKYICFFLCFILILLAILSANSKSPLIIGIYCVSIMAIVILVQFLHPRFYSSGSDEFAKEYIRYLTSGSTTVYYNSPYTFLKEGLKYERDNKVSYYDYHELRLYVVGLYAKKDYAVNIFICSDFNTDDENVKDFIIPLTHDEYVDIKQNGIFVKNLDYLLDNLSNEIKLQNHRKGTKPIVIKYLDDKAS